MTKPEFIAQVAQTAEVTKVEAEKIVNASLETLQDALSKGENVQFVGFGTFEVRDRAERMGINPKTKEKIKIAARKAVAFKVGKKLKDSLR